MKSAKLTLIFLVLVMLFCLAGCTDDSPSSNESSEIEKLAIVVTKDSISELESYHGLKELDLSGSTCYSEIADYIAAHPNVKVTYTVELFGKEFKSDTTKLDLSALEPSQVPDTAQKLKMLPALSNVELTDKNGKSALSMDDVKALKDAAPNAVFHYTFELFGKTISTTDKTVEYEKISIGNAGAEKIRKALDIMCGCTYFKLDSCGIDYEILAKLRDDYPETKIVWRVRVGNRTYMTDIDTIRAVYHVDDTNSSAFKYCTDVKYMDLGHNEDMHDISFIANMPKLEIVILSGSPISDLSPFTNFKNLEFLELAYCGHLSDVSPLAGCENLRNLNISFTRIKDLSSLDKLPLERLCFVGSLLTDKERKALQEKHPDCWMTFKGSQPYGKGWRYDDNGRKYSKIYKKVREVFGYDDLKEEEQ